MRCGTKKAKTTSAGAAISTDVSTRAMERALLYHVIPCGRRVAGRSSAVILARMPVASEVPARAYGGVEPIRTGRAQVEVSGVPTYKPSVLAEPIHLVLGHAKLKILGQLEADSDRAVVGDPIHRRRVLELRHVVAERKHRRPEEEKVPGERFSERLNFEIPTEQVARVGVAGRIGASGVSNDRVRLRAAVQVRFVMRAGHFVVDVAANPVVREKHAPHGHAPRLWAR